MQIDGCSLLSLSLYLSVYLRHLYRGEAVPVVSLSEWIRDILSKVWIASLQTRLRCIVKQGMMTMLPRQDKFRILTKTHWDLRGDNHFSVSARRSSHVVCRGPRNHIELCVLPPRFPEISENISQVTIWQNIDKLRIKHQLYRSFVFWTSPFWFTAPFSVEISEL